MDRRALHREYLEVTLGMVLKKDEKMAFEFANFIFCYADEWNCIKTRQLINPSPNTAANT